MCKKKQTILSLINKQIKKKKEMRDKKKKENVLVICR